MAEWFTKPWRIVPAQAVLYVFLWIAGIHVIVTPFNEEIGFELAGLHPGTYYWWNALVLISPVMVAAAYALIRHGRGSVRMFGFWLRLGGDLGVLAALTALIATRVHVLGDSGPLGDSPLFGLITLTGLNVFVGMLIVRDIGALVVIERLAGILHESSL